ncbi:MAG: helix-turn-helix domain-containing protein [Spirochaetota bacterium]
MSLPTRLAAGSHILFLNGSLVERLSVFERVLVNAVDGGRRLVVVVNPSLREVVQSAASVAGLPARQLSLRTGEEMTGDGGGWQEMVAAIDALVEQTERSASGWRLDEAESETLIYVDLDSVFARCAAASEMMSFIYSLHQNHAARRRCVVESVSIEAVPRSIPTEFFEVHTDWIFSSHAVPGSGNGRELDLAAQRIALETPEFRHRFLALARTDEEAAMRLVPRLFGDYRRGFLLVDQRFLVRMCSSRAATLLGRSIDEIVNRPLNTCIDGVDFVTLKQECLRVTAGAHEPFVVSWRLAPGNYEPREVTVDAITSEHRTVGYLISVAVVQNVRGPRAVYRELAEQRSSMGLAGGTNDEEPSTEEVVSDSLQGTQITKREHEVLLLILNRWSNREIARHLDIAEVTVKKHLTSIYRKLRITNRAELVRSFEVPYSDGAASKGVSE